MPFKKRLFVSYHHDRDRYFFEAFCDLFTDRYELIEDASVERTTGSNDGEAIVRMLRTTFIARTDHTIVLCGLQTPWRKFVDWEIKAALDEGRGLTGINLPTNTGIAAGQCIVPDRLYDNIQSGYAVLLLWSQLRGEPDLLAEEIRQAASRPDHLIRNTRLLLQKGG